MNNTIPVEVIDSAQDLPYTLRCIFLRELSLFANSVKKLSTGCELCDDVELVLYPTVSLPSLRVPCSDLAYPRLEPVDELHDVLVLQPLKHLQLVVHHLLISLDISLQDDLDGYLAKRAIGFAHGAIGTGTKGSAESIFGSATERGQQWSSAAHALARGVTYFLS